MSQYLKKDKFLSQIIGKDCYNITRKINNIKFIRKSFYFFITRYNPEIIDYCFRCNFKYISSRVIFRFNRDSYQLVRKDTRDNYIFITEDNTNIDIHDLNKLVNELYPVSRFYKDKLLKKYARDIYYQWLYNSLFKSYADLVLIGWSKINNKPIGLLTVKIRNKKKFIDLIVVRKKYQNKGIGSLLINRLINIYKNEIFYVGTEMENLPAVNFYLKNNLKIIDYLLVFHKYVD